MLSTVVLCTLTITYPIVNNKRPNLFLSPPFPIAVSLDLTFTAALRLHWNKLVLPFRQAFGFFQLNNMDRGFYILYFVSQTTLVGPLSSSSSRSSSSTVRSTIPVSIRTVGSLLETFQEPQIGIGSLRSKFVAVGIDGECWSILLPCWRRRGYSVVVGRKNG